MKPTKLLLALLLFISATNSFSQGRQIATFVSANGSWQNFPALLQLPTDYSTATTTKYPLLIFLHGTGEAGPIDGSQLGNIYNSSTAGGPAYFIAHGSFPDSFANPLTGVYSKFIILSPQAPGWSTGAGQLRYILADMLNRYRVDTNRIYLTGLSAGGQGLVEYIEQQDTPPFFGFPHATAMVPMSMASGADPTYAADMVADSTKAWGFGSTQESHGVATHDEMMYMDNVQPGIARFTDYVGGHCCWNNFYTPTYKEVINGHSMNIYEWMLMFTKPTAALTVSAGPDQAILPPANSTSLTGNASDPTGIITNYTWTKLSGTGGTIDSPASPVTAVTGLLPGTYIFQLTVTDNNSVTRSDSTMVIVSASTLPIILTNYNVAVTGSREVSISWTTAQEQNNDHFTIERSANGVDFTLLTTIQASNAPTGSNYIFKDANPLNGYGFYRLSQTDIDGKTSFFTVKKAFIQTAAGGTIKMFPNPVEHDIQIQMNNTVRGNLQVNIISATGSIVKTGNCNKSGDYLFYYLPVDQLSPGLYTAQVKAENYSTSIPFIKQ